MEPTSLIGKLKNELADVVIEQRNIIETDDKQANTVLEHLTALIMQIPSSYGVIHSDRENNRKNMFITIEKIRIYADSMDIKFENPKITLIDNIKAILAKPKYSFEDIFEGYVQYVKDRESNFSILNIEFIQIKDQLHQKELAITELNIQKNETMDRTFSIEQKYANLLKEQEENQQKIADLQGKIDQATANIKVYCEELDDKKQLIEKLKSIKKAKRLKQKELSRKIEELTNKTISKATRTIKFSQDIEVPTINKPDPLKDLSAGLETLEKTLKDLQQEKETLAQKIAILNSTIEKEIAEKNLLKDKLTRSEKTKEELEQTKAKLQGELNIIRKSSQELKLDLDESQKNLETLQAKYEEVLSQKSVLRNDYCTLYSSFYEETGNRKALEVKNEVLLKENFDKEKLIITYKENLEKLKLKLEDNEKKFKEQLKGHTLKIEKELEQLKKSSLNKEQSLKQQVQITEKQLENLKSRISIQEESMAVKLAYLGTLTNENESLKKELMTIKPQIETFIQQNEELHNCNGKLKSQLSEVENAKTDIENKNKDLGERIKMLQSITPPSSPQKTSLRKFPFFEKKENSKLDGLEGQDKHCPTT